VPKKRVKVFVSYSRHDEDLVKPLAGLLGLSAEDAVFLDIEQLKPGVLWEKTIVKAIEQSSVFVICWCCESKKSSFVAREIKLALADRKRKIVPVLFCSAKLPHQVSKSQWIDLRGRVVHTCCNIEQHLLPAHVEKPSAVVPDAIIESPRFPVYGAPSSVAEEYLEEVSDPHDLEAEAMASTVSAYFRKLGKQ
jgi:hypothetical protein